MQLSKKKALAARVLGVGKSRIIFSNEHLAEIKETITSQDILDLHKSGVILIRPVKGRRATVKRKNRRRTGKVKKTVNKSKREYVTITRKLRKALKVSLKRGEVSKEKYRELRKAIRARKFKSKRHLKEGILENEK